ncbi:MAG: hypothetical protein WBC08_14165 [Rhodoferax sp.]
MVRGRVAGLSRVAGMLVWSGAVALSGGAQAQTSVQEQIGRIEIQIAELQAQIDRLKNQSIVEAAPAVPALTKAVVPPAIAELSTGGGAQGTELLKPGQIRVGSSLVSLGGFVDASMVFRLHNLMADVGTPFASLPFQSQGDVGRNTELRGSARASRLSLRIDDGNGPDGARLSAYGEIDFLGEVGDGANMRQVNGYQPRLRQAWMAADSGGDSGFLLLAGQAYSLVTPGRGKGMAGLQEALPPVVDDQAVVGTDFARQWQVRVVKDLGPVSLGVSIENPQTLWGNAIMPNGFTRFVATSVPHSSLGTTPISLDEVPDVAFKLTLDKSFGQFELFGLSRVFRLDDGPNGGTVSTTSLAGGVNARVPVSTNLDLSGSFSYGTGLGRYGAAQLPDATSDSAGKPVAIKALHAQAGLVYHPSSRWSAYLFGGVEMANEAGTDNVGGQIFGYGNPVRMNDGCTGSVTALERGLAFCNGDTQRVLEIAAGGWWTLHQGLQGRLQIGSQVDYVRRTLFADLNGLAPSADNWLLFTSLRYTPF